jgi:hypothetical protein
MTKKIALLLGICLLLGSAAYAAPAAPSEPCKVPYNPDGSVTLPPEGCGYQTDEDFHAILEDLPDGTVIHVKGIHGRFACDHRKWNKGCTLGGGELGGQIETASSNIKLTFSDEEGWSRTVYVPVDFEVHTGQADPDQSSFPTLMTQLVGSANPGDADFQSIQIVAGSNNGFEGDGFTNIENLGNGYAQVDSEFNLSGTLHIVGTPDGRFDGVDGTFDFATTVSAQDECD